MALATGALPLRQGSQNRPWQVSFLPLSFPGGALCQSPVMLIWALQIFGMRSSRKLNPFDTIISASLALCSHGEWPVTPCFLRGWNSCGEAGCRVLAPVRCACPSPAVRMGSDGGRWARPVKHSHEITKKREGKREPCLWWGTSHKPTHTHTHVYTHVYLS